MYIGLENGTRFVSFNTEKNHVLCLFLGLFLEFAYVEDRTIDRNLETVILESRE